MPAAAAAVKAGQYRCGLRPPARLPTKSEFLRLRTTRFISRSLTLLSMGTAPSLVNTVRFTPIGPACSSLLLPWDKQQQLFFQASKLLSVVPPAPAPTASAANARVSPLRTYPWPVSPRQPADQIHGLAGDLRRGFLGLHELPTRMRPTSGTRDGVAGPPLRCSLHRHPPERSRCNLSRNSFGLSRPRFNVKSNTLCRFTSSHRTPHIVTTASAPVRASERPCRRWRTSRLPHPLRHPAGTTVRPHPLRLRTTPTGWPVKSQNPADSENHHSTYIKREVIRKFAGNNESQQSRTGKALLDRCLRFGRCTDLGDFSPACSQREQAYFLRTCRKRSKCPEGIRSASFLAADLLPLLISAARTGVVVLQSAHRRAC